MLYKKLAELNPLRYRGYYYDNETGYYYLQSRYYDPEIGRFISADDFEYIDTSNRFSSNAYIYCWNCPTAFEDAEGTTPKLAIDKQSILEFISNITAPIKDSIVTSFQKLQSEHSASIEKLKFYYMNPGELTSDILSNLLGKDVHIEFKLLKEIRSKIVSAFQAVKEVINQGINKDNNTEEGIVAFSSKKSDSSCGVGIGSALHVVSVILTEIFVCLDLQEIAKRLDLSFELPTTNDYKKFSDEYKKTKADIYYEANKKGLLSSLSNITSFLSNVLNISSNLESLSSILGWGGYVTGTLSTLTNKALSTSGKGRVLTYDLAAGFAGTIVMFTVVTGGAGTVPILLTAAGVAVAGYAIHRYAEKVSYSSYWELGW